MTEEVTKKSESEIEFDKKRAKVALDLGQDLLEIHDAIKDIEALCKDLGIPIVSSAKELNSDSIVIFASNHKDYTETQEINKILLQKLNSNKKTILGFEFFPDFEDLVNDPKRNLTDEKFNKLLSSMDYKETISGLLKVFNEIQQTYSRDRFEIKLFDLAYTEIFLGRLIDKIMEDAGEETEFDKERDTQIVANILDLLKTHADDNLVFYAGMVHVVDLLTKFKEIKESGNKEGIKIDNVAVYLPPRDRHICRIVDIMLGTQQAYMAALRK